MSISATGVAKYNFKCDIEDVLNGSLNSHKSTNSGIYALCIDLIEDYANGKNPIASMPSNRFLPTKTEMACMVSVLNSYFVEGADIQNKNYDIYLLNENKNNCKTLRDMTLIVNENNLAKELRYNDIIPIYPFKVIVMPDNSVDSTIYSKTSGYVFLFAYPEYQFTSGSAYMRYFVINCNGGDNTILCSTNKLAFKIKQPKLMTQEQSYQDNAVKFIDRNVFEALTSMLKSK
jgi:hypothetical protein